MIIDVYSDFLFDYLSQSARPELYAKCSEQLSCATRRSEFLITALPKRLNRGSVSYKAADALDIGSEFAGFL